ncbi:MAG: hypothetical protein HYT07_00700 [Candidatus Levybacteria bacterium]|nr:hypothetical protein [Candidatus Levybacteria bacterium]
MAYRKTKDVIKPNKLKKRLFAQSWCRGASAKWKSEYYQKLEFKRNSEIFTDIGTHDEVYKK